MLKLKSFKKLICCAVVLCVTLTVSSAGANIIHANFNWVGSENYTVQGEFSFDNDVVFTNQVTESNGALKRLSWSGSLDGVEILNEIVVSNYVTNLNNYFFDFEYDVTNNTIKFIDTGASGTWFTNYLFFPNDTFLSNLSINDEILSSNEINASVTLNSYVAPVPIPSSYSMMLLGIFVMVSFFKLCENSSVNSQRTAKKFTYSAT